MEVTHTANTGGTGLPTKEVLLNVLSSDKIPATARIQLRQWDDQRDGAGWSLVVTWKS